LLGGQTVRVFDGIPSGSSYLFALTFTFLADRAERSGSDQHDERLMGERAPRLRYALFDQVLRFAAGRRVKAAEISYDQG
jgi:hypothetical protein